MPRLLYAASGPRHTGIREDAPDRVRNLRQEDRRRDSGRASQQVHDAFASAARSPHPPHQRIACLQVGHALANRCPAHPSRPSHSPNAAMSQPSSLRGHQQPPLPFVQLRE